MSKTRFSTHECPLARSLDQIGDWWTLLVIREVMYGLHRFNDIRDSLGIARGVLSARLKQLLANGILEKQTDEEDARVVCYRLTQKGRDLMLVLMAIIQWSNAHIVSQDVLQIRNGKNGKPISRLCGVDGDGRAIDIADMILVGGRGASPHLRKRIRAAFS